MPSPPSRLYRVLSALAATIVMAASTATADKPDRPTIPAPEPKLAATKPAAEESSPTSPKPASEQRTPSPPAVWQRIFARPAPSRLQGSAPRMVARIALGRRLFSDTRLSANNNRSCATCHDPTEGFSDARQSPLGIDGKPLRRNAPGLWNLAWSKHYYWDGRAPSLEAQARVPIEHPNEMGGNLASITTELNRDKALRAAFDAAFPQPPIPGVGGPADANPGMATAGTKLPGNSGATPSKVLAALAAYERSLISPITRFDRWINGEASALTQTEYQGFILFTGRAGCLACHGGWRLTDDKFHDIGLRTHDPGRSAIDGGPPEARRFKTPGLRDLKHSAPYMHDGSKATLGDVLAHYTGGLEKRPSLAPSLPRNLRLKPAEKAALIAFLRTL